MRKVYNYMYYRAFDLLQLTGNYDLAWGASHFLALFIGLLILKVLYIFGAYLNVLSMGIIGLSVFLSLHIVNYFQFLKNDRYKTIIKQYNTELYLQRRVGRLLSLIVVLILIYSLF